MFVNNFNVDIVMIHSKAFISRPAILSKNCFCFILFLFCFNQLFKDNILIFLPSSSSYTEWSGQNKIDLKKEEDTSGYIYPDFCLSGFHLSGFFAIVIF